MHNVSTELKDLLKKGVAVKAIPQLLVEWNNNRYAGIESVDAGGDPFDEECFPISSIVEGNRPTQGILKGFVMDSNEAFYYHFQPPGQQHALRAQPKYTDAPAASRSYTVGPDAIYKYWVSTEKSSESLPYNFSTAVQPYVFYKRPARTNKIVVGFESTWVRPDDFSVEISLDGDNWTTVAYNPPIDGQGQTILYRQNNGSWGTTVNIDNPINVEGIRLTINSLDRPDERLHLIELSTRLEADLTEYLIGYSCEFSMDEPNLITPIGKASANIGGLQLSNTGGEFNRENQGSPFYGLIDKNARVQVDLNYYLPSGAVEKIRQLTMFTEVWQDNGRDTVNVDLKDFSKFFQEQTTPKRLMEEVTVGEAVWRLCDAFGFVDYVYDRLATDKSTQLPYFWTDGEQTFWEAFQGLAEATQTAIYFDSYGRLQIKTRDAAYRAGRVESWIFNGQNDGDTLADIESANITGDYDANTVNIIYKNTRISDYQNGWPVMEVLWTPPESMVLRSSQLTQDLTPDEEYLSISPKEAVTWLYSGMVNIQGEFIRYDGKEYIYYRALGGMESVWVYNQEEKDNIDKNLSHPNLKHLNSFTGRLKITVRGEFGSDIKHHRVRHENYNSRHFWWNNDNSSYSWGQNGGIVANPNESTITLSTNKQFEGNRILVSYATMPDNSTPRDYGMRFKWPEQGYGRGVAGLVFNYDPNGDTGYFVELTRSATLDANEGYLRGLNNEISFFRRGGGGDFDRFGGTGAVPVYTDQEGKGIPFVLADDVFYDIDVEFRYGPASHAGGNEHWMYIYVNGFRQLVIKLAAGRVSRTPHFGIWTRGSSRVDFEYLYASNARDESKFTDDLSTYDRIRGGYASMAWQRDAILGPASTDATPNPSFYFDEFGPIVHEVREMEVAFEKYPVVHSRIYTSNDSQILVPQYNADPFSAKFLMVNTSRQDAVAQGEDLTLFGAEDSVEQQTMIYGRLVYQDDEQTYTIKDEDAVRKRGKVEVEINNPWIQSKAEAESLGQWITTHWAGGAEEITLSVFGNPLLEIGDVVRVNHEEMNLSADTHRYFIVSVDHDFEQGLSTQLTLRRAKI